MAWASLGWFRCPAIPRALGRRARRGKPNRSEALGVEIDLGAAFQILDNLSFEAQFGYMFNGGACSRLSVRHGRRHWGSCLGYRQKGQEYFRLGPRLVRHVQNLS
jgi:hypothetical protein